MLSDRLSFLQMRGTISIFGFKNQISRIEKKKDEITLVIMDCIILLGVLIESKNIKICNILYQKIK